MPQTKSAKRAARKSRRRTLINQKVKRAYKQTVSLARNKGNLRAAYRVLDVASKKGVIHWKKAARLKSRLAHFLKKSSIPKPKTSKRGKPKTSTKN